MASRAGSWILLGTRPWRAPAYRLLSMAKLRGRTVLITGGSRGLGLELARQCSRLWRLRRRSAPGRSRRVGPGEPEFEAPWQRVNDVRVRRHRARSR